MEKKITKTESRTSNVSKSQEKTQVTSQSTILSFQSEEERNIFCNMAEIIEAGKDVFQTTSGSEAAQKCLDMHGHVTLLGDPGSGTTSIGLHLLRSNRKLYRCLIIDTPEEFKRLRNPSVPTLIFIDDIFGKFVFSNHKVKKWHTCLERIASCGSKHTLFLIFTSRRHVFKEALQYLEQFKSTLFDDDSIIDISEGICLLPEDKLRILDAHLAQIGLELPRDDKDVIIFMEISYGFPQACYMFKTMKEWHQTPIQFFKEPQAVLKQSLRHFMKDDKDKFALLVLVLVKNGKLNLATLKKTDTDLEDVLLFATTDNPANFVIKRHDIATPLIGSYLKCSCDTLTFSHPTVEEVVMFIASTDPVFIIRKCSMQSLYEKVKLQKSSQNTEWDESSLQIILSHDYKDDLTGRFVSEINQRNFFFVCVHQACSIKLFAKNLIEMLRNHGMIPRGQKNESVFHMMDSEFGETFVHWSLFSASSVLFQCILNETQVNQNEKRDILITACICGNAKALQFFVERMSSHDIKQLEHIKIRKSAYTFDVDSSDNKPRRARVQNDSLLHVACRFGHKNVAEVLVGIGVQVNSAHETPMHACCERGHVDLLKYLYNVGGTLEANDATTGTPLFVACQNGHSKAVETLLQLGAKINAKGSNDKTPLLESCRRGHKAIVQTLLAHKVGRKDTDKEQKTILFHACEGLCLEMVGQEIGDIDLSTIKSTKWETPLHCVMKAKTNVPNDEVTLRTIANILLDGGVKIDAADKHGMTALLVAAEHGHDKAIFDLIERGVRVDNKDEDGETLLHKASAGGAVDTVKHILSTTQNVDVKSETLRTPLHLASKNGRRNIIEILGAKGAEVQATDKNNMSPLHFAAESGDVGSVQLLIEMGSQINSTNCEKQTALHIASESSPNAVEVLLQHQADVDARDRKNQTPLMTAAHGGVPHAIQTLLLYNADISAVDSKRRTSLHIAADSGNTASAILLSSKSEGMINAVDCLKRTPLHLAARKGRVDTIVMLSEEKADMNIQDENGMTALHLAAMTGETETVEILLNNRSDISVCDNNGHLALHLAAQGGYADTILALLKNGANVNEGLGTMRDTPLHLAAYSGGPDAVNLLLQNEAQPSVNAQDKERQTPLHRAAYKGKYCETVKLLLDHGADRQLTDVRNRTPLQVAIYWGKVAVINFLKDYEAPNPKREQNLV